MKIGRKFLVSNIVITLVLMIVLSIVISSVISEYIEKDIENDLVKDNQMVYQMISYGKSNIINKSEFEFDLSLMKKFRSVANLIMIIDLTEDNNLLGVRNNPLTSKFDEEIFEEIITNSYKDFYNISIFEKTFLAYNQTISSEIDGEMHTLLIATLITNEDINNLKKEITIVLFATIALITLLILISNRIMGKIINRPVEILLETTKNFSNKEFHKKAKIKTRDEFESLGNAINAMGDSLNKQDIEQRKFYENISHELKTPITVINGYAQGIKTGILDDDKKALDIIIDECNRLKGQIENIIYLSKLDTIEDSLKTKRVNVVSVISSALDKLDSLIIINDIDIVFEPFKDYFIDVDEEKMRKVFINILSNCIKYTKDTISINIKEYEDSLYINISDNGVGFSNELLENPFNRSTVGEKGGSGIGLSIVKKIIDSHNGEIVLSNNEKGGANISLKF